MAIERRIDVAGLDVFKEQPLAPGDTLLDWGTAGKDTWGLAVGIPILQCCGGENVSSYLRLTLLAQLAYY